MLSRKPLHGHVSWKWRQRGRDVVHYARAWKKTSFKTNDGQILNRIGQADDGTYIGLDNVNSAYVLLPNAKPDPRLRVAELNRQRADRQYSRDRRSRHAGVGGHRPSDAGAHSTGDGQAAGPPRGPGQPKMAIDAQGHATVPASGPLAVIWTDGVIAPFETAVLSLPRWPRNLAGGPGKPVKIRIGGDWDSYSGRFVLKSDEWDQTWNAPLLGPANPRPGTVYRFTFEARRPEVSSTNAAATVSVASHLSTWGTGIGAFFQASGTLAEADQ